MIAEIKKSYECDKKKIVKPYSMSGFLYHTNLTKKEFEKLSGTRRFKDILKNAALKIEAYIEEKSLTGELSINASQASLKYYFGWGDKEVHTDTEVSRTLKVALSDDAKELAQ